MNKKERQYFIHSSTFTENAKIKIKHDKVCLYTHVLFTSSFQIWKNVKVFPSSLGSAPSSFS